MAKRRRVSRESGLRPTFEVRFVGPGVDPGEIPLRAVSDAMSAIQDLASGRDSFETASVPQEKSISLVDVRKGSAIYSCVSRAPDEALANLSRVGAILSGDGDFADSDELVVALRPIQYLSDVARHIGCQIEVSVGVGETLMVVARNDYERISKRLLLTGETTIIGDVKRVGGATGMKCALRVPGRRKLLFCDVQNRNLVRRLGQHLYETIVATGQAVWIHRSWRVLRFTISDFTQPNLGDPSETIAELRAAGLSAWDEIDDPEGYLAELRQ